MEPPAAGIHPCGVRTDAHRIPDRRTGTPRSRGALPFRGEPPLRRAGRNDDRRRADRAVRRCARGGQRPADARRTAATDLASGQQARTADGRIRPPLRRSLRRRAADPDLSGRTLLAAARRRGERHAVAAQLHQARPRFGAQDRTALRRRPAVGLFLPHRAAARTARHQTQRRDALASRRDVPPGRKPLPYRGGRSDSARRPAGTLRQQADTVRGEVYRLKEKLPCTK